MSGIDDARIVGVYTTQQSRDLSHRTGFSLALESLHGALADAGMDLSEVDGIGSSLSDWPPGAPTPRPGGGLWAYQLGRPLHWVAPSTGVTGILEAARAISSGYVSTVALVVGLVRPQGLANAPWTEYTTNEFTGWAGAFPVQPVQYALVAQRYMHEFGADALDGMAETSATIRSYGHINPDALYFGRGPFTAEDVLGSRMIATPLTLLMCSPVNDGGCAIIMTHKDRAKDTPKSPIRILCGGEEHVYPGYVEPPVLDAAPDEGAFARERMARAGITTDDIDVVEVYDHFAIGVLMEYEMYGFCGRGEASDFVKSGAMKLNGRFPTSTDGGLLSYSHNGSPMLFRPIEAVRQMRGEVKDLCPGWERGEHTRDPSICRAVQDPKVAFVSSPASPTGGAPFMVVTRE